MKFVDPNNPGTENTDESPLFRNDGEVDLMKSESGFENITGNSVDTPIVEPLAETISTPEQLNPVQDIIEVKEDVVNEIPVENSTFNSSPLETNAAELNNNPILPPDNKDINEPIVNQVNPVVNEPILNTSSEPNNSLFDKPKKKGKGLLITILIVLLLVGAVCAYYFVFLSSKNVIGKSFDKINVEVSNKYEKLTVTDKPKNLILSGDFSISSDVKELKDISKFKLNYDFGIDIENETLKANVAVNYDSQKAIDLLAYYKANIFYLNEESLLPRMLMLDMSNSKIDFSALMETENINYPYLVKVVTTAIKDNIDFSKISKTLSFNETTDFVAIKLVYAFDTNENKNLTTSVVNAILDDEEALNIYSKINNLTIDEAKDKLNYTLTNTDYSVKATDITTYYNVFNGELLKIVISSEEEKVEFTKNKDDYTVDCISYGDEATSIKIVSLKDYSEIKISGSMLTQGTTSTFEMNIKNSNENENKTTTSIEAIYTPDIDKSSEKVTVNVKSSFEKNATIESVDTKDAAALDQWSAEELNGLYNNIYELLSKFGLEDYITE